MKGHLRANLLLLVFTAGTGCVLYPGVMYALGQGLFPAAASGSLVDEAGKDAKAGTRGSRLIAQPFTGEEYFWPRPSAAGYNATASGGSNWGANNPKLRDRVAQQLGPMVVYRVGSRSAGPDAANPRTPQQDIEGWFVAAPGRAAAWAAEASVGPANWAKTDYAAATASAPEKYGLQGEFIRQWANSTLSLPHGSEPSSNVVAADPLPDCLQP